MNNKTYKYNNDDELFKDLKFSFTDYLKPIFDSCGMDKKTFVIQVINLVLVFIITNFLLKGLFELLTIKINGGNMFGIQIFLSLLIIVGISLIKGNKILQWQTLFRMNFALAIKYLKRFIAFNLILYGIKEYYKYDQGNKK